MKSKFTTLCYLEKDDCYLMLHRTKKEHDFNKGKWIGVGGHLEEGESPEDCLVREVLEETGLTLHSWQMRGMLTFLYEDACEYTFLYTSDSFSGGISKLTPGDTLNISEGVLSWIPQKDLLTLSLFEGDLIFLRLLAENAPFFSLKLTYQGDRLTEALLDRKPLELLDIVDENGTPTGITRERTLCHTLGTRHRTAHVWFARLGEQGYEILLQKRSLQKDSYPDCYDISSAGHIPAGCTPVSSALRELQEELGLSADADSLEYFGCLSTESCRIFHGKPFHNREFSLHYLCTAPIDINKLVLQESEVQSVCWMSLDTVIADVSRHASGYCLHLEELKQLQAFLLCKKKQ